MPITRALGMSVSRVGRTLPRGLRVAPFSTSVQKRADATVPFRLPDPRNEPNNTEKGSPERKKLEEALFKLRSQLPVRSDVFYNGSIQATSNSLDQVMPSEHGTVFTNYPMAYRQQTTEAIEAALKAKRSWEETPFVDRAAIFQKAAELATTEYRYELIAATMLGQGKNIWQGEIDAAAELADFFRLNYNYATELLEKQPTRGTNGMWSRMDWRPIEGFVYAISPFNFTAIGGNLISGPALMAQSSTKILLEAGLPPNVIQFLPGDAVEITHVILKHKDFGGINFVGSSKVFRSIYGKIGQGIAEERYKDFPRVVGETSGKNFHLIHPSADIESAVNHTVRGAFEYQGQKCSATSRVYLPESQAEEFLKGIKSKVEQITIGSPDKQLEAFMGPVIHKHSFNKIKGIIDSANKDPSVKLLAGGTYDDSVGYFVKPTVYQVDSPDHRLFNEEIFGPVFAVYVYPDSQWSSILKQVDEAGGGLALTGAIFAKKSSSHPRGGRCIALLSWQLLYQQTTAALIGQQSFGGGRSSGTNDKAGSSDPLRRFASPRMIKEEFFPQKTFMYPSNES
ncbi:hypothetical protein CEP52_012421 [Fusarium oligoseptatum]|uniref:L-glutamate gamma-semialdehyde dehydrogenase n=1 Tax=Fusarium oligoseptatum TaxID=2604345 RepID=A0A428SYG3_9HYPO|nr:hypothetical protein CEP52_012421 [Fusarium oligoseptatum]